MNVKIITFNPWLYSEIGHSLIYTQFIEKAADLNQWEFLAFLPKKSPLENLPDNWKKKIGCPTVRHWFEAIEKRPYRRPRRLIRARQRVYYHYSTLKLLIDILSQSKNEKKILFLEACAQTDLRVLVNLLKFLPKKNLSLWIIHRYKASALWSDLKRFDRCHQKLIKMGVSLKLLTDSDLLQKDLEEAFKLPVSVLPIHYIKFNDAKVSKPADKVICWWPGVVREGKGLKLIQGLIESIHPDNKRIHLVVNEKADLQPHDKSPQVTLVENFLSRKDYVDWMSKSDVILLPYSDPNYEKSTSSIFIEAIIAKKIPLVYPKTWMAYELNKYGLDDLAIDWESDSLSEKIIQISSDTQVREKLNNIREAYLDFHCLEKYAQVMKQLMV